MSNIETLIDTVRAEGLQTRDVLSTEFSWFEYMNDNLVAIRNSIVSIQERIFVYFDEEQERFEQAQRDLKEARRAEAERLKESGARGFTTPAKTSSGEVAETPTQEGGLLSGLGFAGMIGALGAAVTGYFAGLATALGKSIAALSKGIVSLFQLDNVAVGIKDVFKNLMIRVRFFVRALSDVFQGRQSTFAIKQFGAFSKTLADFGAKLQKALQPITDGLNKLTNFVKTFFQFSALSEVTKLFPSGGKFLEGIKAFGSKLAGIFNVFAKIAVPLTAIIGTVKGIFSSFEEFGEDTSLLEKILITLKNVVKELISAFVTSLLELGKDIISWVAGALGFTAIEEYLDSFDIDQKFREIFDGLISGIVDWFNRTKDALYQAAEALGIVDTDPEAEARIAQREVDDARESLAEAETRVQEAQAAVEAAPEGSREQARAQSELNLATNQRNARAEDVQEAEARSQEAQVFGRTALDESAQDDSLQAAKQSGLYIERGFGFDSKIDTAKLAETTDVNQLKAIINDNDISPEAKQMVLDRIQELEPTAAAQPTATADQLQEVTVPSRETRSETPPSARPTLVASTTNEKVVGGVVVERDGQPVPLTPEQIETVRFAGEMAAIASESNQPYDVSVNPVIETVSGQPGQAAVTTVEPRVEPLSDLTNVTNINQATTAMQAAISSIIPSEAGDLNLPGQDGIDGALSPASIMGAGLGAVVDGVKNLTSLPVGQASQEVAAAKDRPPVVAMGGSTTSIQNNVSSPNVHNYGSMSARSNDLSAQRLKDHMMA